MRSLAPGAVRDEGQTEQARTTEILTRNLTLAAAQAELNFRSGQALVALNDADELAITFPPGYHAFVPGRGALYTWALDGSVNVRGLVYDTDTAWLLVSLSYSTDNATGIREVQATFRPLAAVAPSGESATIPAANEVTPAINSILPWTPYQNFPELPSLYMPEDPEAGDIPPGLDPSGFIPRAPTDGSVGLQWDAGDVTGTSTLYYVTRALTNAPRHRDITPASGEVKHALFDIDGAGAYALLYFSGPDQSRIYHTADVHDAAPVWNEGGALDGEYFALRRSGALGRIYACKAVESGGATGSSYTYDFESGAQTWEADDVGTTRISGDSYNYGTYCWQGTSIDGTNRFVRITKDFSPADGVGIDTIQFAVKNYTGFAHNTRAYLDIEHDAGTYHYSFAAFSGSGQKWEVFSQTGLGLTGVTKITIEGWEDKTFNNWIQGRSRDPDRDQRRDHREW